MGLLDDVYKLLSLALFSAAGGIWWPKTLLFEDRYLSVYQGLHLSSSLSMFDHRLPCQRTRASRNQLLHRLRKDSGTASGKEAIGLQAAGT